MSWNEWRSHDLEAQFNPRTAVGVDVATTILNLWATESKARKVELTGRFDLPYGAHKLMRFDLHLGAANKPIIINIHGGYWRALDKADVNHHMADLAKTGFGLVNINYPLCPEVSLTQIIEHLNHGVEEVLKRLKDAEQQQPIILMGHSAGAHIALHLSNHSNLKDRLVGVVGLSGIYETELVRELSVNEDVRLTEAEAKRWNCVTHMPLLGPAYYIAVGGGEPSGWIDQSWVMASALRQRGDPTEFHVCGGLHHFNLVDCISDGGQQDGKRLHEWMLNLYC